ncbi:MAG: glycoside hydrolase family 2 TIM barrel-domain containing protein [Terracidiphilus sp.]|jgi:beta-galactosidase
MMNLNRAFLFAALAFSTFAPFTAAAQARVIVDFNSGWKFFQGEQVHGEEAGLDDSGWRAVTVPHDWSIAGPVDEKNPSGPAGGFFPTGIAWYRKSFSLPAKDAHRHVYIAFDGVMANSDVWINGIHLGHRPNGYVSFFYELTGHVKFGLSAHNVIAVRCDTSQQPASRWYEGGGIYRPVRLVLMRDVHLEPWSTFVTTPEVAAGKATVRVESTAVNESDAPQKAALEVTLAAPDGHPAGSVVTPEQTIAKGERAVFAAELSVPSPQLWEIDHQSLYRAVVRVRTGTAAAKRTIASDDEQVQFGIREFHFDAATGFWLNGRNFKIKGVGLHADGGAVGIAVPTAIWERRLAALRALGVNAIRIAHNPPSPEFLDLCDRMGFVVMEEMFDCWTVGKNPYDYHLDFEQWSSIDARDTVRRDRNHPSIILWSAGNEIRDTPQAELAKGILAKLLAIFHENDPSRPVTQALFRPNVSHDYEDGLADMLDVVGQNYRENELLAAHAQRPSRKILGTENNHDRKAWLALRDNPPYSGQFLWLGIDYLGEAGKWPNISRPNGLLDRTGQPYPRAWERQSWWASAPNVHIGRRVAATEQPAMNPGHEPAAAGALYSDWTPQNAAGHTESVEVYSNCEEVELLLNGHSLGRQKQHPDASPLAWDVLYEPGSLRAVAYNRGAAVAEDELRTAGRAARIVLFPERTTLSPSGDDAVTIVATVVDDAGVPLPESDPAAASEVQFRVSGPAVIAATDNGSNTDHESFLLAHHRLYGGRMIAILRATASSGGIRVHASAAGLAGGEARLTAVASGSSDLARAF